MESRTAITKLFLPHLSGGLPPTRAEVVSALRAGTKAAAKGDVPIPGGWDDFAAHGELFYERMRRRFADDRLPEHVSQFPFPKPGGLRPMSWLDPYDDVHLRVLVGRCSGPIERARDSTSVFNSQLEQHGPGWRTKYFGAANQERKAAGKRHLRNDDVEGLGALDVRNFYLEITMGSMRSVLFSTAAPAGAVAVLTRIIDKLPLAGGVSGIPIGPESSALLGNVFLTPLDDALRQLGPFVRWTDDIWVFPHSDVAWKEAKELTEHTLAGLGLRLNDEKAKFLTKDADDPWHEIEHAIIEYVSGVSGSNVAPDVALDMLTESTVLGQEDWKLAKYAVANLRSSGSPDAVQYFFDHPEIFVEMPTQVGGYFLKLAESPKLRKHLDPDWFADFLTAAPNPRRQAARLQACRVLETFRTGQSHASVLLDLATAGTSEPLPLRCWAAYAWGKSGARKPAKAISAAEGCDELMLRRAFCHALPVGSVRGSRKAEAGCKRLLQLEPDLASTIAFVSS